MPGRITSFNMTRPGAQLPKLNTNEDARVAVAGASTAQVRRVPSPVRPPISPITPTLGPTDLHGTPVSSGTVLSSTTSNTENPGSSGDTPDFTVGRPTFAHTTQVDQTGMLPPPAAPIVFDENTDVLAVQSAISILQLQRARAAADMRALRSTKEAALADPAAFVADLLAGRVGAEPDPLFPHGGEDSDYQDEDDEDEDEEEDAADRGESVEGDEPPANGPASQDTNAGDVSMNDVPDNEGAGDIHDSGTEAHTRPKDARATSKMRVSKAKGTKVTGAKAWRRLPKPQNVVRCPPINWAQYGVVGESLDKLHAEQVAAPTPGAPAVLGPGDTIQFRAGDLLLSSSTGEQQGPRLVGVAAPYTPGKDKIDKKTRGKR